MGSAPASRGVGPSDCRRHQAVAAIIAPLSVQSVGRRAGRRPRPVAAADLGDPGPQPGVGRDPAAEREHRRARVVGRGQQLAPPAGRRPPPGTTPRRRRRGSSGAARWWFTTAVLSPAKEKSASPAIARGKRTAAGSPVAGEAVDRPGRPGSRGRDGAPPCRTPRPRRRRRSGRRRGSGRAPPSPRSWCAHRCTMSTASGGSRSGSSNHAACRWASRWFTPTYGRSAASAIAFAALTPTSSAPASPGPWHAATASRSVQLDARFDERLGDHRRDELHVGAARHLGHHAAEARVEVDLARHDRRVDEAPVLHDRGGGLVARRLDAEHEGHAAPRLLDDRLTGNRALDRRRAARRTRAGRRSWHRHHQRVLVDLLVVVLAHADRPEPEAAVHVLRRRRSTCAPRA